MWFMFIMRGIGVTLIFNLPGFLVARGVSIVELGVLSRTAVCSARAL